MKKLIKSAIPLISLTAVSEGNSKSKTSSQEKHRIKLFCGNSANMNSLYVTVSIPLLLVLAGFSVHAHGLTTFGKSNNQGQQNNQHPPPVPAKSCTSQYNCTFIRGTTCIRQVCLCGDNSQPLNGICQAKKQGHNHICTNDTECVEGAICKDVIVKPSNEAMKQCQCFEGADVTLSGKCGGETLYRLIIGLVPLMIAVAKLF